MISVPFGGKNYLVFKVRGLFCLYDYFNLLQLVIQIYNSIQAISFQQNSQKKLTSAKTQAKKNHRLPLGNSQTR